jgi:hypothetical protein
MKEDIKRAIVEGRSSLDIRNTALRGGMITLRRCALLNAMRGRSTVEEALRVTLDDRRRGHVEVADEDGADAQPAEFDSAPS